MSSVEKPWIKMDDWIEEGKKREMRR